MSSIYIIDCKFIVVIRVDFIFFRLAANGPGYGRGRVAGEFIVAKRQSECGRKTCKLLVSQPVTIGEC